MLIFIHSANINFCRRNKTSILRSFCKIIHSFGWGKDCQNTDPRSLVKSLTWSQIDIQSETMHWSFFVSHVIALCTITYAFFRWTEVAIKTEKFYSLRNELPLLVTSSHMQISPALISADICRQFWLNISTVMGGLLWSVWILVLLLWSPEGRALW